MLPSRFRVDTDVESSSHDSLTNVLTNVRFYSQGGGKKNARLE